MVLGADKARTRGLTLASKTNRSMATEHVLPIAAIRAERIKNHLEVSKWFFHVIG